MGSNTEEAIRAKTLAEKQFLEKNFVGAQKYAARAQTLCKELDGISQMVATFGVYKASEATANGELDFYSILGVDPSVEKSKLKKQYKKMAVTLHPDKNKTVGADGAFRLVSEAWTLLSDSAQRSAYDQRRSLSLFAGYSDPSKFSSHGRIDTFWTVCTSCHVQYEYLRKYVNKRLSCKNCRGVFVAVETGLAPPNDTFQYNYSYAPENGYGHGNHGRGVAYIPPTTGYGAPNVVSGHHTGYRSEYASNISFQGSASGNSVGLSDPSGLSSSSFIFYQANGEANPTKANGNHRSVKATGHVVSNGCTGQYEALKPKRGRPAKKRKVELGISYPNGHDKCCANVAVEPNTTTTANGILRPAAKLPSATESLTRRSFTAPAVDGRQLLIDKARTEIRKKLEEMKLADEAAAVEADKRKTLAEADKLRAAAANKQLELKRTVSITVPDSDFHDFDQDRSEECFKPKQIWALYDEEDDSGFTKSCGSFRVFHSETVEQVNIFSHLLAREKAGRGGCVRIYPRSGDIWAVYRNWSPDWNRTTPAEVRHQYEMVEVLDDYSEDNGVCVAPVIKLDGYKTVYHRDRDKNATRWIPRREMLRFSHQVPSCSLKVEGANLPEGCWDLDPAATPEELLQGEAELHNKTSPGQTAIISEIREEEQNSSEEKVSQSKICASTPDNYGTQAAGMEPERITTELPQVECRNEEAPAKLPCVGTGARS
ncbi:hypothetical protein AAHA92_11103 [Salvia divinorum]|uniref:J domain-containing protein n=1 Tax=Salvia divinorum TaxID=28513 RepID=A0ABD1HWX4_SALDI